MKCLYYLENDQKIIVSIYLRNFYLISYVLNAMLFKVVKMQIYLVYRNKL